MSVIAFKRETKTRGDNKKITYTAYCTTNEADALVICKKLNHLNTEDGSFSVLNLPHYETVDQFDGEVTAKAEKKQRNELRKMVKKMDRGSLKAAVVAGLIDGDKLEEIQAEIQAEQTAEKEKGKDANGAVEGEEANAEQSATA